MTIDSDAGIDMDRYRYMRIGMPEYYPGDKRTFLDGVYGLQSVVMDEYDAKKICEKITKLGIRCMILPIKTTDRERERYNLGDELYEIWYRLGNPTAIGHRSRNYGRKRKSSIVKPKRKIKSKKCKSKK